MNFRATERHSTPNALPKLSKTKKIMRVFYEFVDPYEIGDDETHTKIERRISNILKK